MNRQIDANANKLVVKMCMVSKYNQQIAYERKEITINKTKTTATKVINKNLFIGQGFKECVI